jgi:hypothetical protein
MTTTTPYPQPVRSNGLGIAGFIVSLVAFATCGILSPIALLLSFIALFRRPRGFAFAGFILGLVGSIVPLAFIAIFGLAVLSAAKLGKPGFTTVMAALTATKNIHASALRAGTLPDDIDGNAIVGAQQDGWGHPLRYRRISVQRYEIRSAGPDGIFDNGDDIPSEISENASTRPE